MRLVRLAAGLAVLALAAPAAAAPQAVACLRIDDPADDQQTLDRPVTGIRPPAALDLRSLALDGRRDRIELRWTLAAIGRPAGNESYRYEVLLSEGTTRRSSYRVFATAYQGGWAYTAEVNAYPGEGEQRPVRWTLDGVVHAHRREVRIVLPVAMFGRREFRRGDVVHVWTASSYWDRLVLGDTADRTDRGGALTFDARCGRRS